MANTKNGKKILVVCQMHKSVNILEKMKSVDQERLLIFLKFYGSHDMNKKVVNAAIGEYHRLNKLGLIKKGSVQSTAYLRKDRYINNFISSSVAPEKVQQRVNKKSTTLLHDKQF